MEQIELRWRNKLLVSIRFRDMQHSKQERSLVIIKPDGVQRSLIGEVIKRYERTGLKLLALKMVIPTDELITTHYSSDPDWLRQIGQKQIDSGAAKPGEDPVSIGKRVLGYLVKYMSSGPVVAMVWQGMHAVEIIRKITGSTEPRKSDVGTIRGDFVTDSYFVADSDGRSVRNIIHASSSAEDAEKEIKTWFKDEEILAYKLIQESIIYDVNLDGILE